MQVELESCLFCRKAIKSDDGIKGNRNKKGAKVLSMMFNTLCFVLQIKIPIDDWNFKKEQFPFCRACCIHIARLCKLYDQLKLIHQQINKVVAVLSATAIESKKSHESNTGWQATFLNADAKNGKITSHKSNKYDRISRMITTRFDAKVLLKDCQSERSHEISTGNSESVRYCSISDDVIYLEPIGPTTVSVNEERNQRSTNIPESNPHEYESDETDSPVDGFDPLSSPAAPDGEEMNSITVTGECESRGNDPVSDDGSNNNWRNNTTGGTEGEDEIKNSGNNIDINQHNEPNSRSDQQSKSKLTKSPPSTIAMSSTTFPATGELEVVRRTKTHSKTLVEPSTVNQIAKNTYECGGVQMVVTDNKLVCKVCNYYYKKSRGNDLIRNIEQHVINFHTANDGDISVLDGESRTFMVDGYKFTEVEGSHLCATCGIFCSAKRNRGLNPIREHIRFVHLGSDAGKCLICGEFKKNLKDHLAEKHNKDFDTFICDICGRNFKSQFYLKLHKSFHEKDSKRNPEFQCNRCGSKLQSERWLDRHMKICEGEEPDDYTELSSNKQSPIAQSNSQSTSTVTTFQNSGKIKIVRHHNNYSKDSLKPCKVNRINKNTYECCDVQMLVTQGELRCLQCDYKARATGELNTKIKNHVAKFHTVTDGDLVLLDEATRTFMMSGFKFTEVDGGYMCVSCDKFFSKSKNGSKILQHIRYFHLDSYGGTCPVCGEYKKNVGIHLAQTHPKDSDKCICDICGKEFKHHSHLKLHLKLHQNEPKVQCDRCGRKFSTNEQLRNHMRTHTGEKPYKCDTCGKKFRYGNVLKTHVASVHAKIRPFACDQCEWTFGVKFLLTRHIKQVHQGIKPPPPKKRKVVDESISTSSESDENDSDTIK